MSSIPRRLQPGGGRGRPKPVETGAEPAPTERAVVDCGVYVDGVRRPTGTDFRAALAFVRRSETGFVWLGLHSPDERQMAEVADVFNLHPLMVEDAVHAHQRPKLEMYDDTLFMALRTVKYIDHGDAEVANDIVETGEIMLLAGRDYVITVRHGEHTRLAGVRRSLESRPEHLRLGPATVVHAIADHVVDSYLTVVADMESDVDELEERIFAASPRDLDIDIVYLFKREVLQLRRAVRPLGSPLSVLSGDDGLLNSTPSTPIGKEIRRHFRDVADHLRHVNEMVTEYDERLTALLNAAATKVSTQMNVDMRKISAWAGMAAVPTAIAGIYGMNFDFMPELHLRFSYPVVLLVMLSICFGLWRIFRHHHWL